MENSRGSSSIKSMMYNGKNALLPPKIPLPSRSPSCLNYNPSSILGQKGVDGGSHKLKGYSERKESSHAKASGSDSNTKRAKQQYAHRSRVKRLQHISELEINVQALQAEGSVMSAEFEYLYQQSLILSMENKALKQRLDNLAQEQLIKYLEHEVLEREVTRLRALYQQQQLKKDLDQIFGQLKI